MILRTRAGDIRTIGRATQGVRLIGMDEGDEVVGVAKLAEKEDENGELVTVADDAPPEPRASEPSGSVDAAGETGAPESGGSEGDAPEDSEPEE
jgi:DNA gyrase subunit A